MVQYFDSEIPPYSYNGAEMKETISLALQRSSKTIRRCSLQHLMKNNLRKTHFHSNPTHLLIHDIQVGQWSRKLTRGNMKKEKQSF